MNIFLVYGGKSAEHDVSILSAYSILKEIYYNYYAVTPVYISREGKWLKGTEITDPSQINSSQDLILDEIGEDIHFSDIPKENTIVFPVLHGPNGEDGTVQGLLEVLEIPYVGAGVLASATGMDKIISKVLFKEAGLPIVPYYQVKGTDWTANQEMVINEAESILSYPMFVKPSNMGSSVGISEAKNREELVEAVVKAFEYDRRVLIEQGVQAREIEVAVLGNEDINTSVPGELVKKQQFYDYESKYISNEVVPQIPAKLSEEITKTLREYAARAFMAIDGNGLTRVDFFLTADEEIYINEVNTFPGFTNYSMYPRLWEKTGLAYGDLIEEMIQLGLRRFKARQNQSLKDR
ncbi:D-alanine--D-alanine ligase A [Marinilactibacillus sp. 15R]|uniref:D-alanine--D-alanine ligase n=1 Tax=Marinilactibacillus sp. 15R TaxID=1911586 RepID=UPI00090B5710|nr:D-alanine--D-alanine ligase [Marinilactibacillus sp. 15R]API88638.1 D-alanine--D-alanine ligase A [Marinilactibacillus sp. 15R]